jgi:hypothetical protein
VRGTADAKVNAAAILVQFFSDLTRPVRAAYDTISTEPAGSSSGFRYLLEYSCKYVKERIPLDRDVGRELVCAGGDTLAVK